MWFDAGWVCAENDQDIRLGEVIEKVRKTQPGMLCCDRTIGGEYENYVTPEQCVPDKPLSIPWESCITMGTSFSFRYEDEYKSAREIIRLLIDIVCKGGNLAINVGPQPDGRIPEGAIRTMKDMGKWLSVYGDAIYGTRPVAPYRTGNFAFTQKNDTIYAIWVYENSINWNRHVVVPVEEDIAEVTDIANGKKVDCRRVDGGYLLTGFDMPDNGIARAFAMKRK